MKKEIRKNTISTMLTDTLKAQVVEESTKQNKSTSQFISDLLIDYFNKQK